MSHKSHMAKIVKHLPIWCQGGVKTSQQFSETIARKLKITNKIFCRYLNIDLIKNKIINKITKGIMLSKHISSMIFILSINLSVIKSLMDLQMKLACKNNYQH